MKIKNIDNKIIFKKDKVIVLVYLKDRDKSIFDKRWMLEDDDVLKINRYLKLMDSKLSLDIEQTGGRVANIKCSIGDIELFKFEHEFVHDSLFRNKVRESIYDKSALLKSMGINPYKLIKAILKNI